MTLLNSGGLTEPKFTKFTHNIARSSQINFKTRMATLQSISECQGYE